MLTSPAYPLYVWCCVVLCGGSGAFGRDGGDGGDGRTSLSLTTRTQIRRSSITSSKRTWQPFGPFGTFWTCRQYPAESSAESSAKTSVCVMAPSRQLCLCASVPLCLCASGLCLSSSQEERASNGGGPGRHGTGKCFLFQPNKNSVWGNCCGV